MSLYDEPRPAAAHLDAQESAEAQRLGRPRAAVVYETIRLEGEREGRRDWRSLGWSALAAGLSLGFSLVAEGLLAAALPTAPWTRLVTAFGYSVGFIVVVLGRQQLFTENTLTAVLPVLNRPSVATLGMMLRLWAVVLVGNLAGALGFAAFTWWADPFPAGTHEEFVRIGQHAMEGGFWALFGEAIFAGWLIALLVWLLPAARGGSGKLILITLITWLIGLGGLAHCVAGSVEVLYVVVSGHLSALGYLGGFLLPAMLGNIVGGVAFVALLNHAQVVTEHFGRRDPEPL